METIQNDRKRTAVPTAPTGPVKARAEPGTGVPGEPTTLLAVRPIRQETSSHVTSAELREHDAVVRAGLWGAALSTVAVLVISALMGLMRG